jgi:hypothetical protein
MQSNAVLQFETWSREERSFREASIDVDRERKRMEESLLQLRTKHKQISSDTRESSDLLGRFHRDYGLLQQEKERLSRQLMEERTMLEQCSHDAKELLLQVASVKAEYQQKIEIAQKELSDIQYQYEAHLIQAMLNTKTASVLQDFLSKLLTNHDSNNNDKLGTLFDTIKAWKVTANTQEHSLAEVDRLAKKVKELRCCAMEMMKGKETNVCESNSASTILWLLYKYHNSHGSIPQNNNNIFSLVPKFSTSRNRPWMNWNVVGKRRKIHLFTMIFHPPRTILR